MDLSFLNPTPDEMAQYAQAKRRAGLQRDLGVSQLQFQRGTAKSQYAQQLGKLGTQEAQQRRALPGRYAQRGLLNSGIYKQGLVDWAQGAQQQRGQLALQHQTALGQNDVNYAGLQRSYTNEVLDANEAEQARRASIAASLRQLAGG